jgi:hypothetical protein
MHVPSGENTPPIAWRANARQRGKVAQQVCLPQSPLPEVDEINDGEGDDDCRETEAENVLNFLPYDGASGSDCRYREAPSVGAMRVAKIHVARSFPSKSSPRRKGRSVDGSDSAYRKVTMRPAKRWPCNGSSS